jgi:hypothetical protein
MNDFNEVRFEVVTAVTMKNSISDVAPCDFRKNRRFGGTYRPHHRGEKTQQARNNVCSCSSALFFSAKLSCFAAFTL